MLNRRINLSCIFLIPRAKTLLIIILLSALPAYSQWWERGKGYKESSVYARAYCYGRGDKLNHEEALYVAFMIDKIEKITDKEKTERTKRVASMILEYIAGSGSNDEFAGCRRSHTGELIQSAR